MATPWRRSDPRQYPRPKNLFPRQSTKMEPLGNKNYSGSGIDTRLVDCTMILTCHEGRHLFLHNPSNGYCGSIHVGSHSCGRSPPRRAFFRHPTIEQFVVPVIACRGRRIEKTSFPTPASDKTCSPDHTAVSLSCTRIDNGPAEVNGLLRPRYRVIPLRPYLLAR